MSEVRVEWPEFRCVFTGFGKRCGRHVGHDGGHILQAEPSTSQSEPCPMAPFAPQETCCEVDGSPRCNDCPMTTPPADAPEQQDDEQAAAAYFEWRAANPERLYPSPSSFAAGWAAALASRRPAEAEQQDEVEELREAFGNSVQAASHLLAALREREQRIDRALALARELEDEAQRQVDEYPADSDAPRALVGRSWVNAARQFRAALDVDQTTPHPEEPA